MLGNLQIYRKESEPRDRESFLWIHTDEDGNTVAQIYNGVKWMTIGSTSITDAEVCCEVNSTRIAEHEVAIKELQESDSDSEDTTNAPVHVTATRISENNEFEFESSEFAKAEAAFDSGNYNIIVHYADTDYFPISAHNGNGQSVSYAVSTLISGNFVFRSVDLVIMAAIA